jgi:ribosome-binding protein aMBF1 (putative translation factor)
LDAEFKQFLLGVLTKTLYIAGKEEYQRHVAAEPEKPNSASQERKYLKELEKIASKYAARAVSALEKKGLKSHADMLNKQQQVKKTMGVLQTKMFAELSASAK